MDSAFLASLGLDVTENDGVVEAELTLESGQTINPLTRKAIGSVTFTVMGDRLLYVAPPEFVGAQPINLAYLTNTRLEDLVVQTLNDHLFQLERRSTELATLGISPNVDPQTLQLTAELKRKPFSFTIGASRNGQFKVIRALNGLQELTLAGNTFELSEFRDKTALQEFLFAMFSDLLEEGAETASDEVTDGEGPLVSSSGVQVVPEEAEAPLVSPSGVQVAPAASPAIPFSEIFSAFGDASLPPRSTLEILVDLKIAGKTLRFVAARVQGRTFRGLLAGPKGKVWADRFELDDFPGVRPFVADILGVEADDIEVVG